jgi:hypothetical protein
MNAKQQTKPQPSKLPLLTRSSRTAEVTNSSQLQAHTWIGKYSGLRCPGFCNWYCWLILNPDFLERSPAGAKRNWESFFSPVFVYDHRTTAQVLASLPMTVYSDGSMGLQKARVADACPHSTP